MNESIYGYRPPRVFEDVKTSVQTLDAYQGFLEAVCYDVQNLSEAFRDDLEELDYEKLKKDELLQLVKDLVKSTTKRLKEIEECSQNILDTLPDLENIADNILMEAQ